MEVERIIAIVVSHLMFIVGLSELIHAKTWATYLEELFDTGHSAIVFVPFWLLFGLVIVNGHNIWVMGPPVIITILGWIMVIKCALYLLVPQAMLGLAKKMRPAYTTLFRISGAGQIILGTFVMLDTYNRYG